MPVQHRAGELRDLYKAQDYAGMVKWIRDSMGLDLRVKLGLVNKGGQRLFLSAVIVIAMAWDLFSRLASK